MSNGINPRLIAQAPAMLAALKGALLVLGSLPSYDGGCGESHCQLCAADAEIASVAYTINNVIAAAEGTSCFPQ